MNVYVVVFEELIWDGEFFSIGAHPGQRRLHGLLHHLADLSGHGEAAFTLHFVGFDEENVAARRCPSQTNSHTRTPGALGNLSIDADFDAAQELRHNLRRYYQLLVLAFSYAARLLAANGADITLQVAHAGLTRVMPADEADCVLRNLNLLFRESVFFNLLRDQIALSDVG